MAIEQIAAFLSAGKSALDLVKGIRDELPKDARSKALGDEIEKAEAALKMTQAEAAKALGYRLCHCALPPEPMLWDKDRRKNVCPKCGDVYPPDPPAQPERQAGSWTRSRSGR